jgi:hypothetical protein
MERMRGLLFASDTFVFFKSILSTTIYVAFVIFKNKEKTLKPPHQKKKHTLLMRGIKSLTPLKKKKKKNTNCQEFFRFPHSPVDLILMIDLSRCC